VELNLLTTSSQSCRDELRKLARMSFCSRKENENEHGKPRFALLLFRPSGRAAERTVPSAETVDDRAGALDHCVDVLGSRTVVQGADEKAVTCREMWREGTSYTEAHNADRSRAVPPRCEPGSERPRYR
jgi:hypothetical protein